MFVCTVANLVAFSHEKTGRGSSIRLTIKSSLSYAITARDQMKTVLGIDLLFYYRH